MIPVLNTNGEWDTVKAGDILEYTQLDWEEETSEVSRYIVLSNTGERSALLQECGDYCEIVSLNWEQRQGKIWEEVYLKGKRLAAAEMGFDERTYERDNLFFLCIETLDGDLLMEEDTMERNGWTLRKLL